MTKKTTKTKALVPEVLPHPTPRRREWAKQITTRWHEARQAIIDLGQMLIEAKEDLPHGEWLAMIQSDLPFGEDAAQRLAKIARNSVLSNTAHARYLPTSREPLYEMTKLPVPVLEQRLADGSITPETTVADVKRMRREHRRALEDEGLILVQGEGVETLDPLVLGDCIDEIPKLRRPVDALVTDPPYWREKTGSRSSQSGDHMLDGKMVGEDEDAPEKFGKMLEVLAPKLADHAHAYVFCDAVSYPKFLPHFEQHFDFRNLLVWDKGRESGVGSTFYAPNFELIMFGTRGKPPRPLQDGRPPSILRYQALPPGDRDHPTPKPVPLLKFLIEHSTEKNDLVVDPYAGSGSTGVACVRTGRVYFLVEIWEPYYNYARAWVDSVENMIEPDDSVEIPPARPRTISRRSA